MMNEYKMIFAADIVPTETNVKYFIQGDADHLFGSGISEILKQADFRCFNLETPLTRNKHEVKYPGPYHMSDPEILNALKKLDPSLITLGNNHILDQGEGGYKDTVQALKDADIPFTGAGKNLEEAILPYILHTDGMTIGIFNCSEYEFAAAGKNTAGANPYDPLLSFDLVRDLKEHCDHVIVLYHGGREFYRYPSPQLQRICRKFIDCGAVMVICQHTHCIGCEESYHDGRIIYGQGNFLFDKKENEYKKTAILVRLTLREDQTFTVEYLPVVKKNECVRLAEETESAGIMADFRRRSEEIKDEDFIRRQYEKLAEQFYPSYVAKLLKHNLWSRAMQKISGKKYYKEYYSPKEALAVLNMISPENHAELFMTALRMNGKKEK
ncbi:MAG: CapA family protein [Solobacterium sp.]|nr:CapA family protein [Solobacterium sp.]